MIKTFRGRLIVLFATLAGGALIISLVAVWLATNNQSDRTVNRELEVSERVFGELMAVRGEQLLQAAEVLTNDFGFREAVASGDEDTIISALVNHGQRINTDLMVLQSPSGAEIAATHDLELLPPLSILTEEMNTSVLVFADDTMYQLVTAPVQSPDLIAWATLGFAIDDELATTLRELTNADITLVDMGANRLIASSLEPSLQLSLTPIIGLGMEPWLNWLDERGLAAHWLELDAAKLTYVSEREVFLIFSADREAAASEFNVLRQQYIGIGLATLLMALVFAGITARRINQPLAQLSDAAEQLKRGDYQSPIRLARDDEFGHLGEVFDGMRVAISKREEQIVHQAEYDLLTDLPNRSLLGRRLTERLSDGGLGVMVLINIARFRELNDRLGQRIGDQILQLVATRLQQQLTDAWWLSRLAGDEFILVTENIRDDNWREFVIKLMSQLEQPFNLNGSRYLLHFRAGVVRFPDDGDSFDTLVRRMQMCAAQAKQQKVPVLAYREGMDEDYLHRLRILQALPDAVDKQELQLHFQPKLNVASGEVIGAEALIRWRHPEFGIIRPDEFIPLAEQTGEIHRITQWVCIAALDQLQMWHEAGLPFMVAINLSAIDLQQDDLPAFIRGLIEQRGLKPESVTLEVTESAIMADIEQAIERLTELRSSGMRISIDDYGTGYASLAQLKRLPVDELKLDRSFIRELEHSQADQTIVRSTLALAKDMQLTTVAEGVEDEAAWRWLQQLGCQTMQGFYFSRPLTATEFEQWTRRYQQGLAHET
ncbi:putative bifunctional diguanylate cyclase/phosphodiesterase [Pseudidiomarina aestuarii]|uniref:putative bifunctional diguanylate cyclase/phosphodiesterase n=1 Tax=Pseudidiomarina aestuarii TaxID=624146 RepID=UPI003A9798DC